MDDRSREIFERALELVSDEARERDEREREEWLARHAEEREAASVDAAIARAEQYRQQREPELVYKTFETPRRPPNRNREWR